MKEAFVKTTISVGDRTVTFEGPRDFVESQVAKYMQPDADAGSQAKDTKRTALPIGQPGATSERDLIALKKPANHPETVAVLAFSLTESGTEDFTEDDIRRAYIRAGVRPPKVVAQALRDAKNHFEFIMLSPEKGKYRLSPHGDRTVRFDLPKSG